MPTIKGLAFLRQTSDNEEMKALYEVRNGRVGMSYVRCYVWADNEDVARTLANIKGERERLEVERLFGSEDASFSTAESSDGWER